MELKLTEVGQGKVMTLSFNRTFMELKLRLSTVLTLLLLVLIVPLWN